MAKVHPLVKVREERIGQQLSTTMDSSDVSDELIIQGSKFPLLATPFTSLYLLFNFCFCISGYSTIALCTNTKS